jgi:hypothetical protein
MWKIAYATQQVRSRAKSAHHAVVPKLRVLRAMVETSTHWRRVYDIENNLHGVESIPVP